MASGSRLRIGATGRVHIGSWPHAASGPRASRGSARPLVPAAGSHEVCAAGASAGRAAGTAPQLPRPPLPPAFQSTPSAPSGTQRSQLSSSLTQHCKCPLQQSPEAGAGGSPLPEGLCGDSTSQAPSGNSTGALDRGTLNSGTAMQQRLTDPCWRERSHLEAAWVNGVTASPECTQGRLAAVGVAPAAALSSVGSQWRAAAVQSCPLGTPRGPTPRLCHSAVCEATSWAILKARNSQAVPARSPEQQRVLSHLLTWPWIGCAPARNQSHP